MTFQQRLKMLMKANDYTQKELAEIVGASQQSVSRWVNGPTEPDIATLIKCASIFGVSVDYLLGVTDTPTIYFDTKKDQSPSEREQALNVAQAALNGEAVPAIPADAEEFSQRVRQIVYQVLAEQDKQTDGQS